MKSDQMPLDFMHVESIGDGRRTDLKHKDCVPVEEQLLQFAFPWLLSFRWASNRRTQQSFMESEWMQLHFMHVESIGDGRRNEIGDWHRPVIITGMTDQKKKPKDS